MALCEQGYLCDVCGLEVETIDESDLYLRYVLGEVDPETLHVSRERHLRCNPTLAQFIVAEGFAPVVIGGFFAKAELDPEFVASEEARVTEGFRRLLALPGSGLPLAEYPLPTVRSRWQDPAPLDNRSGSSWLVPASRPEASPVSGQTP
jgi:hypothetical protein